MSSSDFFRRKWSAIKLIPTLPYHYTPRPSARIFARDHIM
jgi:hypothetical protein